MKTFLAIGLLMILSLMACGGSAPQASATTTPAPVMTSAGNTPAAAALAATIDPGTVSFQISGDVTFTANSGRAQYTYGLTTQRHQLTLSDSGGTYLLAFILPDQPEAGAHPLESVGREFTTDGIYTAAFTQAGVDDSQMFSKEVSGTLTLDSVGDHLSGSFTFTAQNAKGQKVSVSGTLKNIPLLFG